MSVHDVAAVDRVNSLRRRPGPRVMTPMSSASSIPGPGQASLPTSPTRDQKPNSDTLRRAMARHQASLSRPESPRSLNDDLPGPQGHRGLAMMKTGGPGQSSPVVRRRESLRNPRHRLVSSTGHGSIPATGARRGETPGLEETKTSLRNSQIFLDEINYGAAEAGKTLPKMENLRETSVDDLPELTTNNYPYLSHSTYSLPRNHRVQHHQKSNRQFTSTLRESQESLLSTSREFLVPESRETILNRYPSANQSPRHPRRLYPDDDIQPMPRGYPHPLSASSSRRSSPQRYDHAHHKGYRLQNSHSTSHVPPQYYYEETRDRQHYYHSSHREPRGYDSDHFEGYYSDFDYRRSVPGSPAASSRSSRAASPTRSSRRGSPAGSVYSSRSSHSRRNSPPSYSRMSSRANSPVRGHTDYYETQEYIRKASIRLHDITAPGSASRPGSSSSSRVSSRAGSARSSRAASPASRASDNLDQILMVAKQQNEVRPSKIVYVRETFQLIPDTECDQSSTVPDLPMLPNHNLVKIDKQETQMTIDPVSKVPKYFTNPKNPREEKIRVLDEVVREDSPRVPCEQKSLSTKGVRSNKEDDAEDRESIVTQSSNTSSKVDKAVGVDLTRAGISNIEEMLESLLDSAQRRDLVDNDDSARAESVASMGSSASSKGREKKVTVEDPGEAHSMIRRQSVIIEGLTLETDELKRRCQMLEEELGSNAVDEIQSKLEKVEGKLEETETYCYQVVEENIELKSEIENLEAEIAEVQDTFRDKDAKEFKKTKWELENLAKTCRNLQLKLGKAHAKQMRLKQERDEIEEKQTEQKLWKTTAVVAAAAIAVVHLVNKYK